jgi:hypothetical protein
LWLVKKQKHNILRFIKKQRFLHVFALKTLKINIFKVFKKILKNIEKTFDK